MRAAFNLLMFKRFHFGRIHIAGRGCLHSERLGSKDTSSFQGVRFSLVIAETKTNNF